VYFSPCLLVVSLLTAYINVLGEVPEKMYIIGLEESLNFEKSVNFRVATLDNCTAASAV